MKAVTITDFKAKCLRLVEDVRRTGESLEITRRGKVVAIVTPPNSPKEIDWTPGAFRNEIVVHGDLDDETSKLNLPWEVLS